MGEIRKKLNIKKITAKNIFLLVLLVIVMVAIGAIGKMMGKNINVSGAKTAQACWDPPGCASGGCSGCDSCETSGASGASGEGEGGK